MPQGSSGSPVARPRPLMPRPTAIASVSGRRPVVDVVLCCLLCGVCAEVAPAGPSYRGVIYDRPDHTRGDGLYACLGNPRCDMVANLAIFLSDGDPQFGRCAREGRRAVSFFAPSLSLIAYAVFLLLYPSYGRKLGRYCVGATAIWRMSIKCVDSIQTHTGILTLTYDLFDPETIPYWGSSRSSVIMPCRLPNLATIVF